MPFSPLYAVISFIHMAGQTITIEQLAEMVAHGFSETAKKADISAVRQRLEEFATRLDRIENLLLRDHLNRIERLEDSVRVLKTESGMA
jgi:hypothetical protein